MPSVRCMDTSLDTIGHKAAAEKAVELINEFCSISTPYVHKRLEDAFVYSVRTYFEYTLYGYPRQAAKHLEEAKQLLEKAYKYRWKGN